MALPLPKGPSVIWPLPKGLDLYHQHYNLAYHGSAWKKINLFTFVPVLKHVWLALKTCLPLSKHWAGAAFVIIPTYNSENIAIFGIQIGIGVYPRFY